MYKKLTIILFIICIFGTNTLFAKEKADSLVWNMPKEKSIFSVSPMRGLEVGWGATLSYERLMGKSKKIGLIFPFSYLLNNSNSDEYYGNYLLFQHFSFTPGFKFYPTGHNRVTYAIGTNLLFSYGGKKIYEYPTPYIGGFQKTFTQRRLALGFFVNNYLSFKITPKFSFGLEFGLGDDYIKYNYSYNNDYFNFVLNFSLNFGYRF